MLLVSLRDARLAPLLVVCLLVQARPAISQSLPSGWLSTDVGDPAVSGSAVYTGGFFLVSGAGADVWGTRDEFRFVYRKLTGDGTIVARVAGLQAIDYWTKAGVMMRESLAADARHAFALASTGKGSAFQRRPATGGLSEHTGSPGAPPMWVRIQRAGSQFTASRSTDGVTWFTVGVETIPMASTIYVGLAVTSHDVSAAASAVFSSVAVTAAPAASAPVTSPPGMWLSSDIGPVTRPGSTTFGTSTITVRGAGTDIWNTADEFRFAHRQVTGDVDVVARVDSVEDVDPWTKAGVMIRQSLAAGAAHASLFVSPGKGVAFQRRPTASGSSVHTGAGGRTAPWGVKISRRGFAVSAYQSADGALWTFVGVETVALPATFYVGLAVTSHDPSSLAQAVFSRVSVKPVLSIPAEGETVTLNEDPAVALTSPASGATFLAPATIPLSATASDPDGSIARVEFYAGSTMVGADSTAPYAVGWTGVPPGTYSVTAVARDNDGGTTVSGARTVGVLSASMPKRAVFAPSSDHATGVARYLVEFFPAGAVPGLANPVATVDIGKPPIVNGECQADVSGTLSKLPTGAYVATVVAVGSGGSARSAPSPAFAIP